MTSAQQAKLDILVNLGGSSPQQAKQLLDALRQVEQVEKDIAAAQEKGRRVAEQRTREQRAATVHGLGVVGGGLSGGPLGAMSAMGGVAGGVSGVVAAAEQGLNKLARAAELSAVANTTTAQRQRMITDELIPFASALHKISDAIEGVAEKIFQRNQQFEIFNRRMDAVIQHDAAERQVAGEYRAQVYRGRASAGNPLAEYQTFDRRTVAGMQRYGEQAAMLPAQDAEREARVGMSATRSSANFEQVRLGEARTKLRDLERDRVRLQADLAQQRQREEVFGGQRNQAGVNAAAAAVLENEKMIASQIATLNDQIQRAKEAGVRATEAEAQHRRSLIDLQRAELDVLKQREQRMAAIQQAAGSMSRGEFAGSVRALRQVQDRGIGNVSAATAARAAQIAPDYIGREREALGGQRIDAARGMLGADRFGRAFGDDFTPGRTLADTRQQIDRVTADVRVNIQINEQRMAEDLAKAIEPTLARLFEAFEVRVRNIEAEIKAGAIRQSNATNGAAR